MVFQAPGFRMLAVLIPTGKGPIINRCTIRGHRRVAICSARRIVPDRLSTSEQRPVKNDSVRTDSAECMQPRTVARDDAFGWRSLSLYACRGPMGRRAVSPLGTPAEDWHKPFRTKDMMRKGGFGRILCCLSVGQVGNIIIG